MEKLKGTGKIPVIKKVDYQALSQLRKTVSKLKGSFMSQNLTKKLQIPRRKNERTRIPRPNSFL